MTASREAPAAQAASAVDRPDSSSFSRKFVAVLLACAWVAALAVLAFTQANPVTLNRDQILRAEIVVAARIDNVAEGTATVEQQWGDGEALESITVRNLSQTAAEVGDPYILALVRSDASSYEIVAARVPGRPYLVYPATERTLDHLQQLLQR